MLQKLIKIINDYFKYKSIVSITPISKTKSQHVSKIKNRLEKEFNNPKIFTFDSYYHLITFEKIKKILNKTDLDKITYITEKFDCENFALLLKSYIAYKYQISNIAIVINYDGKHAFNLIITPESIKIYEPQTNSFIPEQTDFWKVDKQIILI